MFILKSSPAQDRHCKLRLLFWGFLGLTLLVIFVNYFCLQILNFLICSKSFLMIILNLLGIEFYASNYLLKSIERFCVFCVSNTLHYRLLHILSNMQVTNGLHLLHLLFQKSSSYLLVNKVIAPPTVCKVSISSGAFFKNYDVTKRKLYLSKHTPLYKI